MTKRKKTAVDGLTNVVSGLGGMKSKRSYNVWQYTLLNDWQQLEASYVTNWIAAGIVDNPADDATREWRRIKCDGAEQIAAAESALNVVDKVNEAYIWSRLYGGGAILMDTGQDFEKPLNLNAVKRGSLRKLIVFDRRDLFMSSLNNFDILADNYMQPEFYTIRNGSQRVHWTHFVLFRGARLPRRMMEQTQGWGDSILRKCIDDVSDAVASKGGVSELLQEANIDVINKAGLDTALASDEDESIIKRYELFNLMKSNIHMALLDGDETLTRNTLSLTGVSQVMEQLITWVSGAARQPVTRLFGTSAKGMNATGEGDMRTYYDNIRSDQVRYLDRPLRTLDEVMVRSALGAWDDSFDYVWNPLEQANNLEIAQERQLDAQRHALYMDAGIVQKSQVQRELQSSEVYQFDDDKISELEELESATLFETLPEPDVDQTRSDLANAGLTPEQIDQAMGL